MRENAAIQIDHNLAIVRARGCPNEFTAAELREWAINYLQDRDSELVRFPNLAGRPHWNLWMMDSEPGEALFAVLVFKPDEMEFMCGSGDPAAVRNWSENNRLDGNGIRAEDRLELQIPDCGMSIQRDVAEAWLGRGW
jgi:hypothetical protein